MYGALTIKNATQETLKVYLRVDARISSLVNVIYRAAQVYQIVRLVLVRTPAAGATMGRLAIKPTLKILETATCNTFIT